VKRQQREVTVEFDNLEEPEAVEHLASEIGRLVADLYLSGLLKLADSTGEQEVAA
jgi:hypothetical protein